MICSQMQMLVDLQGQSPQGTRVVYSCQASVGKVSTDEHWTPDWAKPQKGSTQWKWGQAKWEECKDIAHSCRMDEERQSSV